ncbi:RNA polymerase sigma factor [Candidatus Poribacteria bacterium]
MRTEDGSIIYECLNGKPEGFGILVDKYKAGVYAFVCAQVRNFQDAQDVTQEVFIQAYRDLRSRGIRRIGVMIHAKGFVA